MSAAGLYGVQQGPLRNALHATADGLAASKQRQMVQEHQPDSLLLVSLLLYRSGGLFLHCRRCGSRPLSWLACRGAPVATIIVSAATSFSLVHTRNGRRDRSTRFTVSEKMRVPNFSLCALHTSRCCEHSNMLSHHVAFAVAIT